MAMADSFRKSNLSFAASDKDSPLKKGGASPTISTQGNNSRKGFFNLFSGKKKPNGTAETFSPTKAVEMTPAVVAAPTGKVKQKMVNRKNIADGRIRLNVMDNDRVPEDYQIEYRDNPFENLDHNPNRVTSYIENLRSRDFSMINNREVKRFVESQQQKKDIAPPLAVQNLELDLIELADSYEKLFGKFYRFFQGLLPGFCVLHLFLVFGGSDTATILNSYVLNGLRLYQILYLIAAISFLGSAHRYVETRTRYYEALHSRPFLKESLNKTLWKYIIATICFGLTFAIVVFNREFVDILSNSYGNIDASALQKRFDAFRYLSAITAGASLIGWLSLTLALEEISSVHLDMETYNEDLTADETHHDMP